MSQNQQLATLADYVSVNSTDHTVSVSTPLTVANNLTVTGTLTLAGNTVISGANNLVLQSPVISLHTAANLAPLTSDDGQNIGVAFHYYDTQDRQAFLARVDTTGYLTYYTTSTDVSLGSVTGTNLGTIQAAKFYAGNSSVYATVNSTIFTGTANNATYLNGTAASEYQTTDGLSDNVATLTANNTTYVNGKTEDNLNVNSALTSNSAAYLGSTVASGYQTTAGLSANVATLTANAAGYLNSKTESNLNVNSALTANSASYLGSVAAASFVQNTDSRTLSGNLVFSAANVAFTGNVRIVGGLFANGLLGTAGQVLATNGTSISWTADQTGGGNTTANVITSNTLNSDYINIGVGYVTVGNSTVNTVVANSFVNVGNSTVNASLNSTSLAMSNSTANVAIGLQVFKVPIGTTAQRPTAQTGLIRFNTDTTDLEYAANSSTWYSITTQETLTSNNVSVNNNITVGNATVNAVLTRSSLTVTNSTSSTLVSNNSFSISNSSAIVALLGANAINIGVISGTGVNNAIAIRQQGQDSALSPTGPFFALGVPALNGPGGASVIGDTDSLGTANSLFMSQNVVLIGNSTVYASYKSANITLRGATVTGTINSTAFSGSANAATYLNGKTESNLNVNNALTANSASYLGSTAAAGYQTTAGLSANVLTLTANAAGYLNGKTESNLNVNNALTANNSSYLGGTAAAGYQTTAGLSANVATLTANAAGYLGTVAAASYVQNTDSRTLSGNINFTGTNTYFSGKATHNANLVLNAGISVIDSTGSQGTTGQVLTSNGTGNVYWSTVSSGGGSVNVAAQYTWTNTQTFSNVITFNSNVNIGTIGATAGILVTNTQIVIGNSSVNATINSTAFTGSANSANNSSYLGGTAAASFVQNTDTRTLSGNLTFTGANVAFNGTRTFFQNKIQIGNSAGYDFGTSATIEIDTSANTYQQIVIQNANSGTQASGDLVITADSGNDSVNYVDFGINSSLYSNSAYGITGAGDAYLYSSDSQLVLGTASVKDVVIHAGGTAATNRVLTVNTSAVTVNNLPFNVGTGSVAVGTTFIANTSQITISSVPLSANGGTGTSGQVLTSNGTTGAPYWSTVSSGGGSVNVAAQYTWTNTQTFSNTITFSSSILANTINAASHTVGTTFTANATLVNAAAINITGQVNAATLYTTTSVNVGTAFIANTIGAYHTGTMNALSHTVGTNFIANATALVATGYANVTTSVNSALLTVGTSFIANTTGAYHAGTMNAASHTVGTSFIANTSQITISGIPLSSNGGVGTAGQVLTSNGATGAPYWSAAAAGTNVAAQYAWTNTQSFSNVITFSSTTASPNSAVGAIVTSGGIGANGNIYTAGRIGFANSVGANQVYTYYNASTNSLDTVFG